MPAVTPDKRVSRRRWCSGDHAPIELESDGAGAGVLKASGKLSVGHEGPATHAHARAYAMNGEIDPLGYGIGRSDLEFDPAAIVGKCRRIRSQVPFVEDGHRTVGRRKINRLDGRRMAAVIPEKRVCYGSRFGADHAPVKLEIDGAWAGVLKISRELPIGGESPSAYADTRKANASHPEDDRQQQDKPRSVHEIPHFIPKANLGSGAV